MPFRDFLIQLLHEVRAWVQLLMPAFLAWHLPPPQYMDKKKNEEDPPIRTGP
jgi:hypothetical protein